MTRDEAIEKYKMYNSLDPFPDILPAFLNYSDAHNYIQTVGMVWPYDRKKQLNGVTLSLSIGDSAVYWNEKNEKILKDIKKDGEFVLKSNSIAFIQILEELRLPAYIIVRFNLRVTNTYRGLLLGTGPIVDPGFDGKINIPIHNLTNNDYVFAHGEPLIEMEFTKISPHSLWRKEIHEDKKEQRYEGYEGWTPKFDKVKPSDRDVFYYLRRANQGRSIQSSLPPLVHNTTTAVQKVEKVSDKVDTSLTRINVGLLFSFAALLTAIAAIVNIFRSDIREIKDLKTDKRVEVLEKSNLIQKINDLESLHKQDSLRFDSLFKGIKRK
jgi:deoxycytidine triphosphate deaminase